MGTIHPYSLPSFFPWPLWSPPPSSYPYIATHPPTHAPKQSEFNRPPRIVTLLSPTVYGQEDAKDSESEENEKKARLSSFR